MIRLEIHILVLKLITGAISVSHEAQPNHQSSIVNRRLVLEYRKSSSEPLWGLLLILKSWTQEFPNV